MKNVTTKIQSTVAADEGGVYKIGDGVHYYVGSDCYAATVVDVGPRKVVVRDNVVKKTKDSQPYEQDWDILPELKGDEQVFTYRTKFNCFVKKGDSARRGTRIGHGHYYHYDYCF